MKLEVLMRNLQGSSELLNQILDHSRGDAASGERDDA
jgi:hypothetical protein